MVLPVAYAAPSLPIGLDGDSLHDQQLEASRLIVPAGLFAWGLATGLAVVGAGWRMTGGEAVSRRAVGAFAVLGGVLSLPVMGGFLIGASMSVLGGVLYALGPASPGDL